jgi:hypothetical protein
MPNFIRNNHFSLENASTLGIYGVDSELLPSFDLAKWIDFEFSHVISFMCATCKRLPSIDQRIIDCSVANRRELLFDLKGLKSV